MQKLLRLCLWQVMFISIISYSMPVLSAENGGIRMRGPKSTSNAVRMRGPTRNPTLSEVNNSRYERSSGERYGPITSKDTLWNISVQYRPDPSITIYQMLQAFYQTNF